MNLLKRTKFTSIPVYPILFGLYPVLYLWSANRAQQPAYVVIPSLLITLVSLLVIYVLTIAIFRNIHRAALAATLVSFYILTYGQFYNIAKTWDPVLNNHYLIPVTAVILLAILTLIAILKFGSPSLTKVLNLISASLVLFQLASAVPYYIMVNRLQKTSEPQSSHNVSIPVSGGGKQAAGNVQTPRDIYFILLDNYGRQDILKTGSNLDNSELVNALKQRGFQFPDCAQGNYMDTAPVIGSILNMNYLNQFNIQDKSYIQRGHYQDLAPLILNSEVMRKFHAYGYKTVTFRGFMGLIDINNSDYYVNYEKDKSYNDRLETLNFQALYFKTTLFSAVNDEFKIYPDWVLKKGPDFLKNMVPSQEILQPQFYEVYQQNIYAFDALTKIPTEVPSPKFVYAHIYAAHWPFMMNSDGSLRLPFTQEQTIPGYVNGVEYTNSRILGAIDSILANSNPKPVIIIQGDHSNEWVRPVEWSGKDRLKILSAYYLPDGGDKALYPGISPVNNFRLVFQQYFGENINLLPDIHRYLDPKTKKVGFTGQSCMSDTTK